MSRFRHASCVGDLFELTTFGKGVSFMESQIHWHYWPMSDEEYRRALAEVSAGSER